MAIKSVLQTDIGTGGAITHPSILQSTIHKNLRKLTISTTGKGERDLFLSYVVEAPVWKTTYRVVLDAKSKPFLQGWALVDDVQVGPVSETAPIAADGVMSLPLNCRTRETICNAS